MTDPDHRHNTSTLSWINVFLTIALAGFFAWSTHNVQNYLDRKGGITTTDLQTLRVGICGFLVGPKAQGHPIVIHFEHRTWLVYGKPPTVMCPDPAGSKP